MWTWLFSFHCKRWLTIATKKWNSHFKSLWKVTKMLFSGCFLLVWLIRLTLSWLLCAFADEKCESQGGVSAASDEGDSPVVSVWMKRCSSQKVMLRSVRWKLMTDNFAEFSLCDSTNLIWSQACLPEGCPALPWRECGWKMWHPSQLFASAARINLSGFSLHFINLLKEYFVRE